jgi:hypothetical protein
MDRAKTWIVLLSLAVGCTRIKPAEIDSKAPDVNRYGDLSRLASTPHEGLQAEYKLLLQERMTPRQLDEDLAAKTGGQQPARSIALQEAFPTLSRGILRSQLDETYRGGRLKLSALQLERGRELLVRFAGGREKFRQAIAEDSQRIGLLLADGVFADLQFLELFSVGCRVEAVAAAIALADGAPDDALPAIEAMLGAARFLATEWNVTTRITAANARAEALEVVRAVATHPQATRQTHERLLEVLIRETADWPADAQAWIGDRAGGLVAYEAVRHGHYLSLVERDEFQRLQEHKTLRLTAKAATRNVDRDEWFYLQAMRRMIESCSQPYFERRAVLESIRRELAEKEQSADDPILARQILLTDFETGHLRQAQDAARCQAWIIALSAAVERPLPNIPVSPVTGQPPSIEATTISVQISAYEASDPIEIPIRPAAQQSGYQN